MEKEKREKLNAFLTDISDNIIVATGYLTIAIVIIWLAWLFFFHIEIWSAVKCLLKVIAIIGIVNLALDAVDRWLNMKWTDLTMPQDRDKKLKSIAVRDIVSVLCWIFILFICM